jgi:hypothetical protein
MCSYYLRADIATVLPLATCQKLCKFKLKMMRTGAEPICVKIEVADSALFARDKGPQVDFNVNNLIARRAMGVKMALKYREQTPEGLPAVIDYAERKIMRRLKEKSEIRVKLIRLLKRGWVLEND